MSGSNIDTSDDNNDPTRHTGTQNSGDIDGDDEDSSPQHNQQYSTPERWILVLAITILAFGAILLTLRSVIFSLILITIGISLFAYWLYLGVRSRERNHSLPGYVSNSAFTKPEASESEHVCTCSICKHSESRSCMERRCPCCILTRNKQIIGHFNNPLQ
ncbi:MAG: hypothetical protein ACRD5B_17540 [Nitrososphaeraceae archaeon]